MSSRKISAEEANENLNQAQDGMGTLLSEMASRLYTESLGDPDRKSISPLRLIQQGYKATPKKYRGFSGVTYNKPAYGEPNYAYRVINQSHYGQKISGEVATFTIGGIDRTGIHKDDGVSGKGEFITQDGTFILIGGGEYIGPIHDQYFFDHAIRRPDIPYQTVYVYGEDGSIEYAYQREKTEIKSD